MVTRTTKNHKKHLFDFEFLVCPYANMEEEGHTSYTADDRQGASRCFWIHFQAALMSAILLLQSLVVMWDGVSIVPRLSGWGPVSDTTESHQGAMELFWLHIWGALLSAILTHIQRFYLLVHRKSRWTKSQDLSIF